MADDGAEQTLDAMAVRVLGERTAAGAIRHRHPLLWVRQVVAGQLAHLRDGRGDCELALVEERRQQRPAVDDLKGAAAGELERAWIDEVAARIDTVVIRRRVQVQVDVDGVEDAH